MTYHVAVDIGASSGRVVLSNVDDQMKLDIQEVHRFKNSFLKLDGYQRWDIENIYNEIIKGLNKVYNIGVQTCTVGIDTWGVDYCLVDEDGNLLSNPIAYRDNRTEKAMPKIFNHFSKEEIYSKTGIQFQHFNTLYQLYCEEKNKLQLADKILLIPDYLAYRLTGVMATEYTNLTTTQLFNIHENDLDTELLRLTNVDKSQIPEIVPAGTVIGDISNHLVEEFKLPNCKVISVATHDTASAIVGIPVTTNNWAYLSSGTWSLLGVELKQPILSNEALKSNYTNEGGAYQTYRFLKNISGMWFIQEISKSLQYKYSFQEMADAASEVEPFMQYIDLNDPRFLNPKDMVSEIQDYCIENDLVVPRTLGELTMSIYSSLVVSYERAIRELENITNEKIDVLHVVGGGSNVGLLNQLISDTAKVKVIAGPSESSALGNILVQLIAIGRFNNLWDARKWLSTQVKVTEYIPAMIK